MRRIFWIDKVIFTSIILFIVTDCKKDEPTLPLLSTSGITDITATTATCGGNILSDGGATIITRGICWSTNFGPTTNDSKTDESPGTGLFTSSINDLIGGTTYHVRAYATNSVGTGYGDDMSFLTLGQSPSCITQLATNVSGTGATLNGTVYTNYLPTTVTFEYGTTTSYGSSVAAAQSPVSGYTDTSVDADISGLQVDTTYHFRIKAENSLGVVYGSDMEFIAQAPIIITLEVTNITDTTAVSGGNITGYSGDITSRGILYGTPVLFQCRCRLIPRTQDGIGPGSFTSNMKGLKPSTTYYVQSYAYTSDGYISGNIISFKTSP
jgi:hypothetical protein